MKKITVATILQTLREINDEYAERGFKLVGLFGSYARGEDAPTSDIDIAYAIDKKRFHRGDAFAQLDELEQIRIRLERIFRRRVDLVSYNSANPIVKSRLEKELLGA